MDVIPTRFFLEEAAERFGEQPFMLTSDGMFTYHRIYHNVFETALRLKEAGIKEGERIAILAQNGMAYVIILMVMWKMGVIAVPIRSLSSSGRNLEFNRSWMDQNATIIFTSGSSGRPKAILHTPGNHLFSALGSNRNIPVAPGDRWLLSLPLCHVGCLAIIFRIILGGGVVAIPIPDLSMEDNIRELQITHVSMVSTQLYPLLRSCKDFETLKSLRRSW